MTRHRCLDKDSHDAVLRNAVGFLVGMSDFVVTGAPIFSEDDHRVTFPVKFSLFRRGEYAGTKAVCLRGTGAMNC